MKPDPTMEHRPGDLPTPISEQRSGLVLGGRGGPEDELLNDGQEEVFSRTEVEGGRIEHHSGAPRRDLRTCRRALREIGEIAAVAVLPDSQMTDQEALQTIAAIAEWVSEEAPAARPDCGDVIRRINEMTAAVDLDALDDRQAMRLFFDVVGALELSGEEVFSKPDLSRAHSPGSAVHPDRRP